MRSICRAFVLALAVATAAIFVACGGSMTPNSVTPSVFTITSLPGEAEMASEKTLGPSGAPNTIVEYVGMWHAASATYFLNVHSQLKTQYADAGTAQITVRPVILSFEPSLVAEMLPRCAGNSRFFDAVTREFQTQANWASSATPENALSQIFMALGMSPTVISACGSDTTLANALIALQSQYLSQTFTLPSGGSMNGILASDLPSTLPFVVVNGVLLHSRTATGGTSPTLANIQGYLH